MSSGPGLRSRAEDDKTILDGERFMALEQCSKFAGPRGSNSLSSPDTSAKFKMCNISYIMKFIAQTSWL